MKLCVDCKHLVQWNNHVLPPLPGYPFCSAPQALRPPDPVYGHRSGQSARAMRGYETQCGPEATWFEPKPNARRWWRLTQVARS